MSDKLQRFLLENLHIRGDWVSLKSSWQEIQKTSNYPQPVSRVLGEALAAISLLSDSLKFDGSLTLQIRGTQPVTLLVVQASSHGDIRGIAHWQGKIDDDTPFTDLFGAGTMVITIENNPKQGAQQGERYQSLVSLQGESLSECFKEYFAQSEQLKTRLWLTADKNCAAGLLLQSLPVDDGEEQTNNWNHAMLLAETVTAEELLELDSTTLLTRLYHEEDLRLFAPQSIKFACTCSQKKIEGTIYSLGEVEANKILKEQGNISINCDFCNKHYELDSIDIKRLFSKVNIIDYSGKGSVH